METTTVASVNRELAKVYGKGQIMIYRGRGYYYFIGERGFDAIESLYGGHISGWTMPEMMAHVADGLARSGK